MEYTDLNAEIIPLIGGVADPSVIRTVRNVAIDFAKRTKVLTHKTTLVADGHTVEVVPASEQERVFTFNFVKYADQHIGAGAPGADGVYRIELPDTIPANAAVEIEYVTIPTRTSTECNDRIMDTWYETIVAGALSNLFAMKTASWFDPSMSAAYAASYAQGIFDATISVRGEDTRAPRYMAYGGI